MSGDPIAEKNDVLRLGKDETFQKMVERTRERLKATWTAAQTPEAREDCWFKLNGLNEVLREMLTTADRGKRTEVEAERKAERERRKRAGADRDRSLDTPLDQKGQ